RSRDMSDTPRARTGAQSNLNFQQSLISVVNWANVEQVVKPNLECLYCLSGGIRTEDAPHEGTCRIALEALFVSTTLARASAYPQGVMGLSQRKPRNRAKSPSVEQRVSPCSTASAAR